jgi:hypothetical protein
MPLLRPDQRVPHLLGASTAGAAEIGRPLVVRASSIALASRLTYLSTQRYYLTKWSSAASPVSEGSFAVAMDVDTRGLPRCVVTSTRADELATFALPRFIPTK